MKKVNVYGTLGPACKDAEIIKQMLHEGMDGARLNLSHSTLSQASALIEAFHKASNACGVHPELLIDLQGPELRIGVLDVPLILSNGELIEIEKLSFPFALQETLKACQPGQEILLDDGKILLQKTISPAGSSAFLRVIRGGKLESRKSVSLPSCTIQTPTLTPQDLIHLQNAKAYGVTAVMQPFVRSREDLIALRKAMKEADCGNLRLLAKIENRPGMDRLSDLIPYCDEIVIARGDLRNSMDLWSLPAAQKQIARVCRENNRDFMVVTQMLDSMTHNPVPTRAEVNDIFNAVLDGASSVMVTGETATGEYPVLVIRYLSKTVREAESFCMN